MLVHRRGIESQEQEIKRSVDLNLPYAIAFWSKVIICEVLCNLYVLKKLLPKQVKFQVARTPVIIEQARCGLLLHKSGDAALCDEIEISKISSNTSGSTESQPAFPSSAYVCWVLCRLPAIYYSYNILNSRKHVSSSAAKRQSS